MKHTTLIDISNLGFACAASKSELRAGDLDTTAAFYVLGMIRNVVVDLPGPVVVLHDGRSWRHALLPDYKAGRDVSPEQRRIRERWVTARPLVARALSMLGVHQMRAANLEADDLAARLRRHYRARDVEVTLVSGDKDWLQLVEPGVRVIDPIRERTVNADNFRDMIGLPFPLCIAERKALMGKPLEMPGVGGIGEKTADRILQGWGSVGGFLNTAATEPEVYDKLDRYQRSLVDDPAKRGAFDDNMKLAWLDHPGVPVAIEPRTVKGQLNRDGFADLCGELAFFSILSRLDTWLAPFADRNT